MLKGKFNFNNVARNLSNENKRVANNLINPEKNCMHFWITKHTVIKRNGSGDAEKVVCQKCVKCDKERTEQKIYNDTRVIYD